MTTGRRIKERRELLHKSVDEIAGVLGKNRATVYRYENGFIDDIPVRIIKGLAEILETTPEYLMGWSDDPENYDEAEETLYLPEGWAEHFNGDMEAAVRAYRAVDEERAMPLSSRPRNKPVNRLPLIGSIACGTPILAEENIEDWVDVPAEARGDFLLRCQGESMKDARILDGDLVVIRQQDDVQDGQIAAVLIDDEATLKRLHHLPGGAVLLQPANAAFQPIVCGGPDETRSIRILGLATHFISKVI